MGVPDTGKIDLLAGVGGFFEGLAKSGEWGQIALAFMALWLVAAVGYTIAYGPRIVSPLVSPVATWLGRKASGAIRARRHGVVAPTPNVCCAGCSSIYPSFQEQCYQCGRAAEDAIPIPSQ